MTIRVEVRSIETGELLDLKEVRSKDPADAKYVEDRLWEDRGRYGVQFYTIQKVG